MNILDTYRRVPKGWEREIIFKILSFYFRNLPVKLDFLDGDERNLSDAEAIVSFAPPRLTKILKIMLDPGLNFPQAYVDGAWFVPKGELADLILLLSHKSKNSRKNLAITDYVPRTTNHIKKQYFDSDARRETKRHYDIDHEIYELIIGPSMVYSCAFFDQPDLSLEQAQAIKIETTIKRLNLPGSSGRILDIGCGWGTLAMEIAQTGEYHVTGISLSPNQIKFCQDKVTNTNIHTRGKADFLIADYLKFKDKWKEKFDRIVSIGMLEHAGKSEIKTYFSTVKNFLRSDGQALIHSIVRPDTGMTSRWVDRYIFPGGYIPNGSEVLAAAEKSGLQVNNMFYHQGENYRQTLIAWLKNLHKNQEEVIQILKQEIQRKNKNLTEQQVTNAASRSFRTWEFYLSSLQSIFHPLGGRYSVAQISLSKRTEEKRFEKDPN